MPFDCYVKYVAMKQHFTRDSFDYQKYGGKTRASISSYNKRKDRYFFEKMSRKFNDEEVVDFFIANFTLCDDPQSLWIGEIIKEGETRYQQWKKVTQSMSYIFRSEISDLLSQSSFDKIFEIKGGRHPLLLKMYIKKQVSVETMIILDKILGFKKNFDKRLDDPVWTSVSLKMKKYNPFLNINVSQYKKVLKDLVL
ncbi:hypothetical protein CMO86_09905 [Candidatus Woesearchaeota archaeon]|jgi:hypothetical protein|nr:hypothetical protein [Candidatus Woesearchaeota archaeon]|tara:strand:+ start:1199 stop:1786 length:588 start_codon:yes stop_codon:yes gene_type:complete